jgi:hypothetical protein
MVDDSPTLPWLSRPLRIDERIASFVLGDSALDARIARYALPPSPVAEAAAAGPSLRGAVEPLLKQLSGWKRAARAESKPLVYLHGAPENADAAVRVVAAQLTMPVVAFDGELLAEAASAAVGVEQLLFYICREGLLSEAAIFLRNLDRLLDVPSGAGYCRALLRSFGEMGNVLFASGQRPWCWQIPAAPVVLQTMQLHAAGLSEQVATWSSLSRGELPLEQLQRLVSLHPLPLASIEQAWRTAKDFAAADSEGDTPQMEHLRRACRAQVVTPANSLARRIEPGHTWNDLVLPAAQREQLAVLCAQVKHSSIVYGDWGFERKLPLGRGLNALFCGPPGTGKTLAAEIIAADLGLDLLKVDLSQIASKYIGETEKNLRQLFDEAAGANAILFFDEADALFGKRSAVGDAHDRYANTQTAYLLQKMEEYAGVTLLSSNLRQNIDEAFTRRMRFIIDFPFPEEAERLCIWQTVWPPRTPLGADVDLAALARKFRLSGGSIRNVALSAAFLAAEERQPVSMRHLIRAVRRELQNMGRLVNEDDCRAHP